jgi:5'-nucleotidase/UDP-sugar diphosphatase
MKLLIKKLRVAAILFSLAIIFTNSPVLAADSNNDLVPLQILTINDFHGALMENGKNPGAAKIASYLKDAKAQLPDNTVILSAGDMFQGSPDSNLLYGKTVVDFMNTVGFDAMTLGNHEFDWGIDILKQRIHQSNFPYISANIFDIQTKKCVDFARPYIIIERAGIKIAIVGIATPETAYKSNPKVVSSFTFAPPKKIINTVIPELRKKNIDIIIVLSHLGSFMDKNTGKITGESADLAMDLHGIDAIISGHSHQRVFGMVNNIPIVQAQYSGRAIGKINLSFKRSTKQVIHSDVDSIILTPDSLSPNAQVQAIIEKSQNEISPIKNVILGKTVNELSHNREAQQVSLLGQWTTDIMRQTANADIAFTNAGGLRASIPAGNITMGNLYEIIPFDNTLFTLDMTGSQIMKVLEHGIMNHNIGMVQFSGIKVIYTANGLANHHLLVAMSNNTPLDLDKTYKVVTNDFMAAGGDQFVIFSEGKNKIDTYIPLRDILVNAIRKLKVINVKDDDRFIEMKESAYLLPTVA